MFNELNQLGKAKIPFFFLIDYKKKQIIAEPLNTLPADILIECNGTRYCCPTIPGSQLPITDSRFPIKPISYDSYLNAFNIAQEEMRKGNTYLLNLTFPSFITDTTTKIDLTKLFWQTKARYKLNYKNQFLTFSPEKFVTIKNDKITTCPMKGTSSVMQDPTGKNLLNSKKEKAEHLMIVDLLRNDLCQVAKKVQTTRFRYLEKVQTNKASLWQTSSEITGELTADWSNNIGTILGKLTPAGSITGTPKTSTIAIIKQIEPAPRNFYSGIFGIFDGTTLDSAVIIRYIENKNNKFYYHSGGGITINSDPEKEYQELIDKVYLPIVN